MKPCTQALVLLGFVCYAVAATANQSNSANGLDFVYPYPVKSYQFTSQRKKLTMSYMDVSPKGTPKGNIVLLHGKNFCGATWIATIKVLVEDGYRVVVPDQVGFCKSTKPSEYQFTLEALATNTNGLLHDIGITNTTIMGHSMGGMLSGRYALMFPTETYRLVMVDPLGLENWAALGVPYQTPDVSYLTELSTTYDSIKIIRKLHTTLEPGKIPTMCGSTCFLVSIRVHWETALPGIWPLQPTWSSLNLSYMNFPA